MNEEKVCDHKKMDKVVEILKKNEAILPPYILIYENIAGDRGCQGNVHFLHFWYTMVHFKELYTQLENSKKSASSEQDIEKKIPNLDTFSTYIDRLIVENVKLATFGERLERLHNDNETRRKDLHDRIDIQKNIIDDIKLKVKEQIISIFMNGYDFYEEKRTFDA